MMILLRRGRSAANCAPQKKTAQREFRAYVFITVTRDHALNNAVKSSKKHSSSAQSSPGHIASLSFKLV